MPAADAPLSSASRLCLLAVGTLLLVPSLSVGQQPSHPLDPLSWTEHWRALEILRAEGHTGDSVHYPLVTLHEPTKDVVLTWTAGEAIPRAAFAVVKKGTRVFEAEIDLRDGVVTAWDEVEDVQTTFVPSEEGEASRIALADSTVRAALLRRGFAEDLFGVDCIGLPLGYFGEPEEVGGRLAHLLCADARGARNTFHRMLAGLTVVVDLESEAVVEVRDDGVVPLPEVNAEFDAASLGPPREVPGPIRISQPLGPGFELDGRTVRWQNWRFHHRIDPRVGLVVSDVRYRDGERERRVMYQGSLSEIYVPYMDPDAPWYAFNWFDSGEIGPQGIVRPMAKDLDCPSHAVYFEALSHDGRGQPQSIPRASCLFERVTGDVAWRKRSWNMEESRPRRDLVLRTMAVLGNYDYIFDWVFLQDGTIRVVVAASGIDATKAVAEDDSGERADAYGRYLDDGLVGVNHDHFFNFRLDLDVDGTANNFLIERLTTKRLPEDHPRRSLWVVEPEVARTESDAQLTIDLQRPVQWRVVNPAVTNRFGYPAGYQLLPRSNAVSLLTSDDYAQRRAGFTDHHLWVTPYRPDERYAAGRYVTKSEPGRGLPAWTTADRSIEETDLVLWYTVGIHHVPRAEDWPVMPTTAQSFDLRPFDFFRRNPALDLPARP